MPAHRSFCVRLLTSWQAALALLTFNYVFALPALAATTTTNLAVSAVVIAVCAVDATPLAFGNYSATAPSPTDSTATVTATCTSGVSYTIALDAGTGSGATMTTRKMTSGANTLDYSIYTDSNHTTVWGDGTSSTTTQGATAGLSPDNYTAYGRLTAGQQTPTGAYTDTVTVTLTY